MRRRRPRFGSILPAPGLDVVALGNRVGNIEQSGIVGILNLFSGGALLQLAVFALGIMGGRACDAVWAR